MRVHQLQLPFQFVSMLNLEALPFDQYRHWKTLDNPVEPGNGTAEFVQQDCILNGP